MDPKNCESCGMPMKSVDDFSMGDTNSKYCGKCTDEKGELYSFDQKLELMTMFIMGGRQGVPEMMARNMAKSAMAEMPAWKSHFE